MPQMISMKDPATSRPGMLQQPPSTRPSNQELNSTEVVDFNIESESTASPAVSTPEVKPTGETSESATTTAPAQSESTAAPTPTPVEEKQTDAVFDIPATPEPKQPTVAQPNVPSGPRNYDQYPDEIRPVLRALNNKQFAELAPKLKELVDRAGRVKELEERVGSQPQFFYEHPEAYQIMPEFKQLSSDVEYIGFEQRHLADQLVRIKRGESWQELKGYDQKTGQPVFEERKPNADGTVDYVAETRVSQELNKLAMIGAQKSQQLQQFQMGYQQSVQRAQQDLAEINKRLFPKLEEPDKLPAEDKKMYDMATSMAPQHLRSHPLTPILGKSFVMYFRLLKLYQGALGQIDKLRVQADDRGAAEPAVVTTGGGPAKLPVKPGETDPEESVKFSDLND